MSGVEWVKITVDMFDNRKIRHLRRLPDGNSIVLIWVMLLTMAGRCNAGGMIFLTENIPYTPKMLADELGFEENTVKLALQALSQLNMIVINGDFFAISGWEEYQNIEGMEKIRESKRLAQARWRAKRDALAEKSTVDSTVDSTEIESNNAEEDKEEDLDIKNIIIEPQTAHAPKKVFKKPTREEVDSFCREHGYRLDTERFLNYYESNGWMVGRNKMKDWKAAVRNWASKDKQAPDPASSEPDLSWMKEYIQHRDRDRQKIIGGQHD